MGFLSKLKSVGMKAATALVKSPVGKVLDVVTTTFAHPVQVTKAVVGKDKVSDVIKKHQAESTSKQVAEQIVAGVGYIGAALGAGAVASASKAGTLGASSLSLAKSAIPSSLGGKIAVAVAVPVVAGRVISHPVQSAQAVGSVPSAIANVASNLAVLGAEPSWENVKSLVKENPLAVGALATAGVASVGIAGAGIASNVYSGYSTREAAEAVREQTAASQAFIPTENLPTQQYQSPQTLETNNGLPTIQETQKLQVGKRKRHKKKEVVPQHISQRVNVVVSQQQNKRYLNKLQLRN